MHFESECLFHSVGEVSGDAAKLRVTKGISGAASIGNEAPIIAADTFAGDYYAPTDSVDYLLDFRQKCCFVVGAFREQDDVGLLPALGRPSQQPQRANRHGGPLLRK